ncbi:MAG: PEP-CTERM sorting domain-containing protein [Geobacter sp.]|nr:PEP-CTERM sorting domain-containing protein [Geobacter sp.]
MKNVVITVMCGLLLFAATTAQALEVTNSYLYLNEIVDGSSTLVDLNDGSFTGLGTITRNYTAPGTYSVLSFIDNEINLYGTGFDPEFGGIVGTPGYQYQIADPYSLISSFMLGSLDGSINADPADTAVAMGWTFSLLAGQSATVNFIVADAAPSTDYLTHTDAWYTDPDLMTYEMLNDSIYYWTTLDIETSGPAPIPEPSTFVLLGSALVGLGLYARRRRVN